jgi:hypothetical protein
MALDDITPGISTKGAVKRKLDRNLAPAEAQGKKLQIIAFDSAGCPAPSTRTDLACWSKAATPEPDNEGILESEHIWRARLARVGPPGASRGGGLVPQPLGPRAD